jgi:hypothetical protein
MRSIKADRLISGTRSQYRRPMPKAARSEVAAKPKLT